jgi:hypothetical protein
MLQGVPVSCREETVSRSFETRDSRFKAVRYSQFETESCGDKLILAKASPRSPISIPTTRLFDVLLLLNRLNRVMSYAAAQIVVKEGVLFIIDAPCSGNDCIINTIYWCAK